jgi:cyanophycinase
MRFTLSALAVAANVAVTFAQPAALIGPAKGALVIVGGGAKSGRIFEKFVELAGGGASPIVIMPTAEEGENFNLVRAGGSSLEKAGATRLQVVHTRDRKTADSDEFIAPINAARGLWFSGGRQWRLADAYLGTKTVKAMHDLLARGGVIGGSSAGATIQGSFLVRGDPKGNTVMVSPGHTEGFGFLRDSAIDQHVLARGRQQDLIPVIREHPGLLGIGLDEDTAIIVRGNEFEVIGASKALIYDARMPHPDGKPWWTELAEGDRFDLASRRKLSVSPRLARPAN